VRLALIPTLDPSDYRFVHHIRARFAETDAMGVVHHGAYPTYLEEARAMFLRRNGHPYAEVRLTGIDFTVLELFVSYRRPLLFDEVVDVNVRLGLLTRATFQIGYLLQVEGETRSTAVTVHGAVDMAGRAARLPAWLSGVAADSPSGLSPRQKED
jgi:acyl-CoA thioester hydrolase